MSHAAEILRLHGLGLRNYEIAAEVRCAPNTVNWHLSTRGLAPNRDTCKHGHPFSPENTRTTTAGHRACRTCHRLANRSANGWSARPSRDDFDHEFFSHETATTAWMAGLVAADGNVRDHRRWSLALSGEAGRSLVVVAANLIGHRRPIPTRRTSGKDSHQLQASSARQVTDLRERWLVTPRKSLTLQWPDPPDHLVRPFVRGYVDGDGHIGKSKNGAAVFNVLGTPEFIAALRAALPVDGGSLQVCGSRTVRFKVTHRKARAVMAWLYSGDDLPASQKALRAQELIR